MNTRPLILSAALIVLVAGSVAGQSDDRDLLWDRGAPPNVLLIVDSGGTMVHDPETNSLHHLLGGDDPGSKLLQGKEVIEEFVLGVPDFNMGFSYYQKTSIGVEYLTYAYRVRATTTGGVVQTAMLDGTPVGGVLRLGDDFWIHSGAATLPIYPIRYGRNADESHIVYPGYPAGPPATFRNGDIRVVSCVVDPGADGVVDATDACKLASDTDGPWYYPAYRWGDGLGSGLSSGRGVQEGLQGAREWITVAGDNGIDVTDPVWKETLHAFVLADIQYVGDPWCVLGGTCAGGEATLADWRAAATSNQIGSQILTVREQSFEYRGNSWQAGATRDTEIEWVTDFIVYDHRTAADLPPRDNPSELSGAPNFSPLYWQGEATCVGYLDEELDEANREPIVPIPFDSSPSNRQYIASFMGPQATPFFYFPDHTANVYLPDEREHFVPWTETIAAGGRRPIKDTINEAKQYFERVVREREDPMRQCRKDFIILVTDGVETCTNTNAPCAAASNIGRIDIPIYVVGFGPPDEVDVNVLQCVATNSGGEFIAASSADELRRALAAIARKIEERVRGFSSVVVPSVQSSTEQAAYLATFTPYNGRSIWDGHLRAFPVFNGQIPTIGGQPNLALTLWDAGGVLASTAPADRNMFYGDNLATIPGTRYPFVDPGADATALTRLASLIRPGDPDAIDQDVDTIVQFIRGDRDAALGLTGDDVIYEGLKLGDIFHSQSQIVGPPSCFTCYLTNQSAYQTFREQHRRRRQVLFVGADDGALHAFDAGVWHEADDQYDLGTGKELFAWIPRAVMPTLDDLTFGDSHIWTVDGSPTVADVHIDTSIPADGAADPNQREWRSIVLFGERRGGNSYVCLDITKPDTYTLDSGRYLPDVLSGDTAQVGGTATAVTRTGPDINGDFEYIFPTFSSENPPECLPSSGAPGDCDGAWPTFRWEFTDVDGDGNGYPDLGQTWSTPVVGFVKFRADEDVTVADADTRSVAVFGGGWHPSGRSGYFFYVLDLETGKVLYKTPVLGMVTGQVAAVDINLDGFLERIYFGTTAGKIYRIDLEKDSTGATTWGVDTTGDGRVDNWTARTFFDADPLGTSPQPFYLEPKLVPVGFDASGAVQMAVALGSGNRANLFYDNTVAHRFYLVVDTNDDSALPITEADLRGVLVDDAVAEDPSYLLGGSYQGWYLVLPEDEKVNTPALIFSEQVIFSTFAPSETVVIDGLCRTRGNARTYILNLFNADPIGDARFIEHSGENSFYATDPVLFAGNDGSIHVSQTLDNLEFVEPVGAQTIPLRVFSWKED